MIASCVGRILSCLLGRERRSLTGAAEAERAGTLPAQRVADRIGDGDDGVVERGLNVDQTKWHILSLTLLELLVFARRFSGLARGCLCLLSHYFCVAFFLPATVPLRGPLRVRALVRVRWPLTGSERLWRVPR